MGLLVRKRCCRDIMSLRDFGFMEVKDQGGILQCAPACRRLFHQNNKYEKCAEGMDMHYDMDVWLTDGITEGAVKFYALMREAYLD